VLRWNLQVISENWRDRRGVRGGEKTIRRIKLVLALAGFGDGATRRAKRKLQRKDDSSGVLHWKNFILSLIFKIRSLQTVKPFFKICYRDFSRKKLLPVSFLPVKIVGEGSATTSIFDFFVKFGDFLWPQTFCGFRHKFWPHHSLPFSVFQSRLGQVTWDRVDSFVPLTAKWPEC
jgi:hypothetical protein